MIIKEDLRMDRFVKNETNRMIRYEPILFFCKLTDSPSHGNHLILCLNREGEGVGDWHCSGLGLTLTLSAKK